jgi:uncharacterized delta-60 repeat protein/gliding motility-associated-like protein
MKNFNCTHSLNKLIFLCLFFFCNVSFAQPSAVYEGAFHFGQLAYSTAIDGSGNMYVAGTFSGTADFDPGPATFDLTSAGNAEAFVLKLSPLGNLLWAHRIGAAGNDMAYTIDVDASGNVYTTGVFEFTVDFDPGPATVSRSGRIFTQKLDTDGNFIWVSVTSGTNTQTEGWSVIDASGNIYRAGHFTGAVDFDPGAGTTSFTSIGTRDIFAEKLDVDGNLVWVKRIGGAGIHSASNLMLDASNNLLVIGSFQNSIDFDPGAGTVTLVDDGTSDGYMLKLDGTNGDFIWVRQFTGTGSESPASLVKDLSGNIFLAGTFGGTADFDPGAGVFNATALGVNSFFIEKLDAEGDFIWAKTMLGGSQNYINDIALDPVGSIYLTGQFQNTVDFNPDPSATLNVTSSGGRDFFLQKLNPDGALVYIHKFGSTGDEVGHGLTFKDNLIYISGYFTGTVDFDPSAGVASLTADAVSVIDGFLHKLSNAPVSLTLNTQPQNAEVCAGDDVSLTVSASGTSNVTYQWQMFNTVSSAYEDVTAGAGYTGTTSGTLSIDLALGGLPGNYRCKVNGDFVSEVISDAATVTELPLPSAPATTGIMADACGPQTHVLTATSATPGEFRWYKSLTANFPEVTETAGTLTTPRLSASVTYHVSFYDGACESPRAPASVTASYDGPGSLDNSFNPPANGPGSISFFDYMVLQPDGKVLLANFESAIIEYALVRLTTDGSFDPGFTQWDQSRFTGGTSPLGLQSDGKIILGGSFTEIDGDNFGRIARFNSDGTLDITFNSSGSGFNGSVSVIEVQADDKIIATGNFTSYNGSAVNRIVRLNADGTIDALFSAGTGPNNAVSDIGIQNDNKILISGQFTAVDGTAMDRMARLNSDGTLDLSFTPAGGAIANVIALQSDNKILIGGAFTSVGGVSRNYIARLNADGSLDSSFDPGTGFDDWVYSIYQEPSGKILVGGWFQNFSGTARNFLARLNPDGSLDNFFDPGIGPYSLVTSIKPYSANRVLVGGYIDQWNGSLHNGIGLINNECIRVPVAFDNSSCDNTVTISACGGVDGQYGWYTDAVGGTAIAGESNSSLTINNFSSTATYYVTLKDAICESVRVPVVATLGSALPAPLATSSSDCTGESQLLSAAGGMNGQYRWYGNAVGGTAITGETNAVFNTPPLSATTTYHVSINDGVCESARTPVTATVSASPPVPTATPGSVCESGLVTLIASGASNGQYRWYDVAFGGTALSGEVNAAFTTSSLTVTTSYFVSVNDGSCESARVEAIATVNTIPVAPGATDHSICAGEVAMLVASGSTDGNYRWYTSATSPTPVVNEFNNSFSTPALSETTSYFVSVVSAGCESARTEVIATVIACSTNTPPVINTTQTTTSIGGMVTIDLLALVSDEDQNLDITSLQIIQQPSSGAIATISSSGTLTINYKGINFSGTDSFSVRICDDQDSCVEQVFTVEVTGSIIVYNAVSPNDDGLNDILRMEYIELMEDTQRNRVTIFNRWGDVVFEVNDYDNSMRVFKGLNRNGGALPTGTYFYKIEFTSGRETETGYLYLKQ